MEDISVNVDINSLIEVDVVDDEINVDIVEESINLNLVDETPINIDISGVTIMSEASNYELQMDEAGSGITYIGEAVIGSETTEAVWRIKRMDESGDPELIIKWADDTAAFTKIWDNRASYAYA